jgi:cell division protein FtsQ
MTAIPRTPKEFRQRRRQHRREKRSEILLTWWRLTIVGTATLASFGLLVGVGWQLTATHTVRIEGNRYLTSDSVRQILGFQYPQSLLTIDPGDVRQKAIATGGIAQIQVRRELFPPRAIVRVRDIPPVAIVPHPQHPQQRGLVTAAGRWFPIAGYQLPANLLPKLQVRPAAKEICPHWPQLYRAIEHSPVKISEIDCSQPANLMLQTELGRVRLGGTTGRWHEQIATLDRLRQLPQHLRDRRIGYIDLENPARPQIQL